MNPYPYNTTPQIEGRSYEVTHGKDLRKGDRFLSDRPSEGWVVAVCDHGKCTHDRRPDSTHVRGSNGNEWFVVTGYDNFYREVYR